MFATTAALFVGLGLVAGADLEKVDKDVHRMPTRYFALPIPMSAERRAEIDHVLLHVSIDRGKTWLRVDRAAADDERFAFLAPQDGQYWFLQQVVDKQERKQPASLTADTKGIVKVLVEANGSKFNATFNGSAPDAQMRDRLKNLEERLVEFEKRIEEIELRARLKRLERRLAEKENQPRR